MKQWEKGDVPDSATRKFNHYIGDEKGIAGVEATMDEILRGPEGQKTIVKDEKGRTIRMSDYTKSGIGAKLKLTIDAPVQYLLENTLRFAGRAAGVVMDVNTGEVLAMASIPDYDPNDFFPSITQANLDAYNHNKLSPLTNRAISQFAPGSTMKIPIAIAAQLAGRANSRLSCNGYVTYGNAQVKCWIYRQHDGTHGSQNLSEAIQHSCNPYFNILANTIGKEALVEGCSMMNIGKRTGVELPSENPGMLPGSRVWRATYPKAAMTGHEIAMLSIGQGTSHGHAAANVRRHRLRRQRRQILSAPRRQTGRLRRRQDPRRGLPQAPGRSHQGRHQTRRLRTHPQGHVHVHQRGGRHFGQGQAARHRSIASKSGTAQSSDNGKPSNNSWIMSFAPYEKPKYAVCILVQNGGSGGGVCGPLVNLVFRGLFARDLKGVRLPLKPMTKVPGNTDRIEKSIEIPPETIAAVEAGEVGLPPVVTALTPPPVSVADGDAVDESAGDTGVEVGDTPSRFFSRHHPHPDHHSRGRCRGLRDSQSHSHPGKLISHHSPLTLTYLTPST